MTQGDDHNHRILIVDDNHINRTYFSAVLQKNGHHCVACDSGEAALEHCRTAVFACVLMDIRMHGMDGFEATRGIRISSHNSHTPVIAVSAETIEDSEGLFDDVLLKPVSKSTLLELVQQHAVPVLSVHNDPADNDGAIHARLRAMLAERLDEDVDGLKQALDACDFEALAERIHHLKGSVKMCHAPALDRRLESLHTAVKTHAPDVHLYFNRLQRAAQRFRQSVQENT